MSHNGSEAPKYTSTFDIVKAMNEFTQKVCLCLPPVSVSLRVCICLSPCLYLCLSVSLCVSCLPVRVRTKGKDPYLRCLGKYPYSICLQYTSKHIWLF